MKDIYFDKAEQLIARQFCNEVNGEIQFTGEAYIVTYDNGIDYYREEEKVYYDDNIDSIHEEDYQYWDYM